MDVSLEEKKIEAIKRMNYLQLMPEAIEKYKNGEVLTSEYFGILYDVNTETKKLIKEFEEKNEAMVYHVIKGTYDFGNGEKMIMDSLLYISDEKEEWKYDRNDMKHGYIMSYVYNETYPDLSEFGTVGVVPINGGLSRNDQGYDFEKLLRGASKLKPIKGRMECFSAEGKPHIVVDYAHTPDGVEQVLRGVREHHPDGKVFCIIGCGGDRDKGKRPIMAIKASVFSDMAILTSDNPRSEDPESILRDMASGVGEANNVVLIADRRKAIEYAFEKAGPKDCIVIAGKGHEDYQIFKDKTIHFSDREIACELLGVKCD